MFAINSSSSITFPPIFFLFNTLKKYTLSFNALFWNSSYLAKCRSNSHEERKTTWESNRANN